MKKFNILTLIILLSTIQSSFGSLRYIGYDDIREAGGFNSPSLTDVQSLDLTGIILDAANTADLVASKSFISLKKLDLSHQKQVTDEVIEKLANNPKFAMIDTIRLFDTAITAKAIEFIRASNTLGSIRDSPHNSGKHGLPASVIEIYIDPDKLSDDYIREVINEPFHIEYKPQNPRRMPWEPVDHGIKIVKIECY